MVCLKKVNILQVIYQLGDGGVESMLMDIYRNINKEKYNFIFLVQDDSIKYVDEITSFGGKIIKIKSLKEQGLFKYINTISKICFDNKIDVVHAHNLTQNFIVLFSAKKAKVKVRVSHSHLTSCFSKKTKVLMPLIKFFTNLFATDKLACGYEAGKFLYGNSKFSVINNAIDVDRFYNAKPSNSSEIKKIIDNKYVILHVGRLCEQKNHNFILKIASMLKEEINDFVILCCGSGPLEYEIKNQISDCGLDDVVKLLGSRNDIPSLMKSSDIFILPSLYEGLPVTSIEVQAANLKCLLSDTIDHNCDLGLGLVDFLSIDNEKKWVDKINFYKNNHFESDGDIKNVLEKFGYDSKNNCSILEKIYDKGE